MSGSAVGESMDQTKDPFPGAADAGKVLEWISRQVSQSELGKGLFLEATTLLPADRQQAAPAMRQDGQPNF